MVPVNQQSKDFLYQGAELEADGRKRRHQQQRAVTSATFLEE